MQTWRSLPRTARRIQRIRTHTVRHIERITKSVTDPRSRTTRLRTATRVTGMERGTVHTNHRRQ